MQINGGDLGERPGGVVLAGEGWFVDGEVLCFHGNFRTPASGGSAILGTIQREKEVGERGVQRGRGYGPEK